MQDELNSQEMARQESLITDSQQPEQAFDSCQRAEAEPESHMQCQNGVCLVTWKPQRTVAA